jgi:hypothetical protein
MTYNLATIGIFSNFVVLPPHIAGAKFPPDLRAPTLSLASSHLICSVALTGVLALQTGRMWAERADDDTSAAETLGGSGRDGDDGERDGGKPEPKKIPTSGVVGVVGA